MDKINIVKKTLEITLPITNNLNFELVDVIYIKEDKSWFLRIFIDKPGGISIDDCEKVSHELSLELEKNDFIEESYYLEVSSPGLDRPLKKDSDFEKFKNELIEIKLHKAIESKKKYEGTLIGIKDNKIVIQDQDNKILELDRENISLVKRVIKFWINIRILRWLGGNENECRFNLCIRTVRKRKGDW